MSSNNPAQIIRSPEKPESESEIEEEDEEMEKLEKLETEVRQMAKKILEHRTTLPDQLKTTVASLLSSQRPILPHFDSCSDPGTSGELNPGWLAIVFSVRVLNVIWVKFFKKRVPVFLGTNFFCDLGVVSFYF